MNRQHLYVDKGLFRVGLIVCVTWLGIALFAPDACAEGPFGRAPGTVPHDFSDSFYRANGIDPAGLTLLVTQRGGGAGAVIEDEAPDPSRSNVRIIATNGGYDAGGALLLYPDPPAFMTEAAFMNNAAGRHARELADQFRAIIFPKRNGLRFSPAPPNRRQDNLFDTGLGYLTHNPLGLWTLLFIEYTDAALNGGTPEQDALIAEMTARNGLDLDGTPVIRRKHEIFTLEDAGLVNLYTRNKETGENGPPWVV